MRDVISTGLPVDWNSCHPYSDKAGPTCAISYVQMISKDFNGSKISQENPDKAIWSEHMYKWYAWSKHWYIRFPLNSKSSGNQTCISMSQTVRLFQNSVDSFSNLFFFFGFLSLDSAQPTCITLVCVWIWIHSSNKRSDSPNAFLVAFFANYETALLGSEMLISSSRAILLSISNNARANNVYLLFLQMK